MKKLILCVSALLVTLGLANAQGWGTTGAHDDFATANFYKNGANLEGLVWFDASNAYYPMTRAGNGYMSIAVAGAGGCNTAAPNCYAVFGVNFNDANDNGTGTPFVVDLSGGNADITIDIENTSGALMFMSVHLVDINDVQSTIEPNVADVAGKTWADPNRKAINGLTVAAGVRKTVTIDLSSVPANLGGLTTGAYTCSGPNDCPVTTNSIDPSKIKAVLFRVNFGKDNIDLSEGDGNPLAETFIQGSTINSFTGTINIYDFKIGDVVAGLNESLINSSLSVYPNPANEALNISFKANGGADVSISDIVGNKVFSTTAGSGENNIPVNTSNLPSGMYLLTIVTDNGTVVRKVNIK